ncbi:MAG: MurR/RpiR family transcriptional regulator [Coprobacillus sp.]
MNNTLTLLLSVKNREPIDSINYKIADYLLRNLGQLNHMTTSFLASECHVSKSAISRFCRCIGLEDFIDLQVMARTPLQDPQEKYYMPVNENIDSYYINSVQQQLSSIKDIDIDELVDDIYKYENIYLMGHMQSSLPAYNLQYDFAHLGKYMNCIEDIVRQKEILNHADKNDLIIVFSSSGNFFKHSFIRNLKLTESKIYLISSSKLIKPTYVYKNICINVKEQYASAISMMLLTQLMTLKYNQKYITVS